MRVAALAVFLGLIGAAIGDGEGFLAGVAFGVLAGMVLANRARLAKLERDHASTQRALVQVRGELHQLQLRAVESRAAAPATAPAEPEPGVPEAPTPVEVPVPVAAEEPVRIEIAAQPSVDERGAPLDFGAREPTAQAPIAARSAQTDFATQPARGVENLPPAPRPFDHVERWVRELLFGGNTIVRVGILVLLVGVVLLLRWAAEHSVFPIELRMAAAGALALALVGVGYRQRLVRPGFGRTLQGGGVAALYLVVFFSFRTYELLPASLAFALLVCIALASGVLAVLQDALALIVIGQVGGFMAPVLASSGGGSHVALFSYYLLLNLIVFAVAWFKAWRALNLIGFAFTFGVGSTWGALRYRPEHFVSTEPFLLAFFLLYSSIPVLYALRRRERSGGWVDASLVFGTPLAVLSLQYAMVKDIRFGMAFSALGLGAFYVLLAGILQRRAPAALQALIESFLAIGIGFATLAVPYGFDNHDFTGATWSLEGAGLYWVGTRQKRWLSRAAGAGLQLLAAGALLVQLDHGGFDLIAAEPTLPIANGRFLASTLLCLGCLFVACRAYLKRAELLEVEVAGLQLLIALGLALYLFSALSEVERHVAEALRPGAHLAVVAASLFALSLAARRLAWRPGRLPAVSFVLLLPLILLAWDAHVAVHPLGRAGWLAFPLAFALHAELLGSFARDASFSRIPLHAVFPWSAVLFAALEAQHLVTDFAGLNQNWSGAAVAVALGLGLFALVRGVRAARWPFREAPQTYLEVAAGVLALAVVPWTCWANANLDGDAAPLPSWPLLNPLDLAQLVLLAASVSWYRAMPSADAGLRRAIPAILGGLSFLWFNALLARSVHHFAGVAFAADALWDATPLQVCLSVSWSLLGLLGTVLGSVKRLRWLWWLGASLLAIVVAKLFLIDLAQLSTVAKISTFLAVGLLLVLVGYFAPVPPPGAQPREEPAK